MEYLDANLQDEFFYGLLWPKSITEALFTFLLPQKGQGHWVWNSNNGPALMGAREYLNETFHTDYTNIEVLGRVRKLRSRYGVFSTMISHSGVLWNRDVNYLHASPQQWADWREIYPMSQAYQTQCEHLFTELKTLFAPDDGPHNDHDDDDELIIIVDSDDEVMPVIPYEIVQALSAINQDNMLLPMLPIFPDPEIVVISSDESNHGFYDYFDSDVDIGFSDDEQQILELNVKEMVGEIVNPHPQYSSSSSGDDIYSPRSTILIPAESLFAIREAIHSIPHFQVHNGFTTSDEDSE